MYALYQKFANESKRGQHRNLYIIKGIYFQVPKMSFANVQRHTHETFEREGHHSRGTNK